MDEPILLPPEESAGAAARLQFLQEQMRQLYITTRQLQMAIGLATNNGELSSEFRHWAYTQLLQTAAVVQERGAI